MVVNGIDYYAINSMLYLRTIKDKYIGMYNEFLKEVKLINTQMIIGLCKLGKKYSKHFRNTCRD